jgi:hypothetical protein
MLRGVLSGLFDARLFLLGVFDLLALFQRVVRFDILMATPAK